MTPSSVFSTLFSPRFPFRILWNKVLFFFFLFFRISCARTFAVLTWTLIALITRSLFFFFLHISLWNREPIERIARIVLYLTEQSIRQCENKRLRCRGVHFYFYFYFYFIPIFSYSFCYFARSMHIVEMNTQISLANDNNTIKERNKWNKKETIT